MTATTDLSATNGKVAVNIPEPSVELVDPDTAREWLGRNDRNRNLRKSTVDAYARDMKNGHWRFTGEAINFSTTGALLNGQHRLHAIIQADVTLSMLVVRNVDDEAQDVMDTGAKRSPADALSLHGEKSTSTLASLAAMIANEGGSWNRKVTTAEILEVLDQDDSIRTVVADVMPSLKLADRLPPTVAAYAYWRLNKIDPARTAQFFSSLSTRANLDSDSPILALDTRLRKFEGSSRGSRAFRLSALACIFYAWNAWIRGESRVQIKVLNDATGKIRVPDPIEPE